MLYPPVISHMAQAGKRSTIYFDDFAEVNLLFSPLSSGMFHEFQINKSPWFPWFSWFFLWIPWLSLVNLPNPERKIPWEVLGQSDFFRDFPAFQAQADGKDGVCSKPWLGDPSIAGWFLSWFISPSKKGWSLGKPPSWPQIPQFDPMVFFRWKAIFQPPKLMAWSVFSWIKQTCGRVATSNGE